MAPNDNHLWTISTKCTNLKFLERYVHLHGEIEKWVEDYDKMIHAKCYIASVGERIVGFILLHLSIYNNNFAFKIDFIYVSQSYRGQGVASSLLKSAPRISFVTNMMKYERLFQKNDFVNDFRNNYIKF